MDKSVLVLWCDRIDRDVRDWRKEKANHKHSIRTTFDDCPDEDTLPCPKRGCGGTVRTRPVRSDADLDRLLDDAETEAIIDRAGATKKKKARKKRTTKKKNKTGGKAT